MVQVGGGRGDVVDVRRLGRRVAASVAVVIGVGGLAACGGDRAFVPYAPPAELVPLLADDSHVYVGGYLMMGIAWLDCPVGEIIKSRDPGPNASEWRTLQQIESDPERQRGVSFATQRFSTRDDLDDQMERFRDVLREPCAVSSGVEPMSLDGLPDGAITAHWPGDGGDGWTTVIGDPDRQLMMIARWREEGGLVPPDGFVEVVNEAWAVFESENS